MRERGTINDPVGRQMENYRGWIAGYPHGLTVRGRPNNTAHVGRGPCGPGPTQRVLAAPDCHRNQGPT